MGYRHKLCVKGNEEQLKETYYNKRCRELLRYWQAREQNQISQLSLIAIAGRSQYLCIIVCSYPFMN